MRKTIKEVMKKAENEEFDHQPFDEALLCLIYKFKDDIKNFDKFARILSYEINDFLEDADYHVPPSERK